MDAFDESVRRGTVTAATADACLQAFDVRVSAMSWPEAVQATIKFAPAKRVLRWLWSPILRSEDVVDFFSSSPAKWLLICNAQLEGNTELLWKWMLTKDGVFDNTTNPIRDRWRASVHRNMIHTKLFLLAMERKTQADEAIDLYFTLRRLKLAHPSHEPLQRVSCSPAISALVPHICSLDWPGTSTEAYSTFAKSAVRYLRGRTFLSSNEPSKARHVVPGVSSVELIAARLDLWRPGRPDPDRAIAVTRKYAKWRQTSPSEMSVEQNKLFIAVAKQSAKVLDALGRRSERLEMVDIIKSCGWSSRESADHRIRSRRV